MAVGGGTALGALCFDSPAALAPIAVVAAAFAPGRHRAVALALVVAMPIGLAAGAWDDGRTRAVRSHSLAEGPIAREVVLRTDPVAGRFDEAARASLPGGVSIVVAGEAIAQFSAGDLVFVEGVARPGQSTYRGMPVVGKVSAHAATHRGTLPWFIPANALRDRVRAGVADHPGGGGALVSGFLIGEVSALPALDYDRLTAAGLSHFVAVSGSNVALFLALWWFVTLPLAIRPRLRWIVGLVGLGLFVLVTRWEPSVLRAASMAGLVLVGRAAGIPLSGWSALGLGVAGLVLVDASIVGQVGFQLSAAATLGLLVGAGIFEGRGPRWLTAPLGASVAAQVAVAPLLLIHFGEVPLVSPAANLVAGPLVAMSTSLGGIGVLVGADVLVEGAVRCAEVVLAVARIASGFPALGWWGTGVASVVLSLLSRRGSRPIGIVALAASVGVLSLGHAVPEGPSVAVLDVGQGDAILLTGPAGERILVDGGPDPRRLAERLGRHGVDRLDLVVISHRHADHVAGLDAVWGQLPVEQVWVPPGNPEGALVEALDAAGAAGIPVRTPTVGARYRIGEVELDVLGPARRYASPNDASLVLVARVGGVAVGLVGDIETWAQADLGPLDVDVLKVPHQGAATSDDGWLGGSAGVVSIISVGVNDYGHPAEWVVDVLERAGSVVCRTDRDGDVVVPLRVPVAAQCSP